jgi:hypothetical protein
MYEARGDFEGALEMYTAAAKGLPLLARGSAPELLTESVVALSDAGLVTAAEGAAAAVAPASTAPVACAHGGAAYRAGVLVYRGAGAPTSMASAASWFSAAGGCTCSACL